MAVGIPFIEVTGGKDARNGRHSILKNDHEIWKCTCLITHLWVLHYDSHLLQVLSKALLFYLLLHVSHVS